MVVSRPLREGHRQSRWPTNRRAKAAASWTACKGRSRSDRPTDPATGSTARVDCNTSGKRYQRFAETGEYFLKVGADAPENLFAYEDFDATPNVGNRRKTWTPHLKDYNSGRR